MRSESPPPTSSASALATPRDEPAPTSAAARIGRRARRLGLIVLWVLPVTVVFLPTALAAEGGIAEGLGVPNQAIVGSLVGVLLAPAPALAVFGYGLYAVIRLDMAGEPRTDAVVGILFALVAACVAFLSASAALSVGVLSAA